MQLIIRLRREKDSNKCQSCSFGAESVADGVDEAGGGDSANEHGDPYNGKDKRVIELMRHMKSELYHLLDLTDGFLMMIMF